MTDDELLADTDARVERERHDLSQLLRNFREIERRRLFSREKCESLHRLLVKRWNYSDAEAKSRTAALQICRELPEVEEKIKSGAVNLTTLLFAQTFFNAEKREGSGALSKTDKLKVIEKLEGKSTREVKQTLFSLSTAPKPAVTEKIRQVAEDIFEYRFGAETELHEKIEKLKGLLAHKYPNISLNKLMHYLTDLGIEKEDPAKQKPRTAKRSPAPQSAGRPNIPTWMQREVWRRAHSRCENCGSHHALQIDHITPIALGGETELENLRLLCRNCNQRAAIHIFGVEKMQNHFFR